MSRVIIALLFALSAVSSTSINIATGKQAQQTQAQTPAQAQEQAQEQAPESFLVEMETDVDGGGKVVLNVTRAWAPIGVDHFYKLVRNDFYTANAFFRVVPDFVVQFGINGDPTINAEWSSDEILDDPVVVSNTVGTVTYATAGPDTRTTQLFINLADNSQLDSQGFAPFATVVEGMDVVQAIYNPTPNDSNGINQDEYSKLGNDWLTKRYPDTNMLLDTTLQ
mmetsp:Transcript_13243/g.31007  ORF Transcript_13243/g.31007 Transcript_13243/m.31007 type:complete len:223 (+) Transcript_13243:192-860(+)|eukprot:CAMPEP_0182564356 /NCGR_PEP_ID=MMETSP1324-20130603/6321_1 /TAXON_ID=236786 /ORGANISM="Florenciella sp., Strain RCC1587" /LENGTH=222 /DNA_ID=CAMNT_0024777797 /DNA_START=129 /DNA_END=797 /DNA_ORIENTATION=+